MMYRLMMVAVVVAMAGCASVVPPEGLTRADMKVVNSVHAKVLENWLAMPYLDSAKKSATVKLDLNGDGSIAGTQIIKSSGNVNFDNGLLVAIRQAAPFKIPAENRGKIMSYDLTFTK